MFNPIQHRYVTAGVNEQIPEDLQAVLWLMIEQMNVDDKDYLQVFELSPIQVGTDWLQQVIHRQEEPAYRKEHRLFVLHPVRSKLYVIDDISHSTMLLAEEY